MNKIILIIVYLVHSSFSMRHNVQLQNQLQQVSYDEDGEQRQSQTPVEAFCDDGQQMLDIDWDGSPHNYTCNRKTHLSVQVLRPLEECQNVPDSYQPKHFCMDERINYRHILPTHEGHRPVWPVYGEYVFVPPQRWLHSVEHGALVMLYHPCADPKQVSLLRQLVVNCIRKHIITANSLLPMDTPLALVAWGCRLVMSKVDANQVIRFIRQRAMKSPEYSMSSDGQYNYLLIRQSTIPSGSDFDDSILCPQYRG